VPLVHSFLLDVAADEAKLQFLVLVGDDLESGSGTHSVLLGPLFAEVAHGVELVLLDQLLLVEAGGLCAFFLQTSNL